MHPDRSIQKRWSQKDGQIYFQKSLIENRIENAFENVIELRSRSLCSLNFLSRPSSSLSGEILKFGFLFCNTRRYATVSLALPFWVGFTKKKRWDQEATSNFIVALTPLYEISYRGHSPAFGRLKEQCWKRRKFYIVKTLYPLFWAVCSERKPFRFEAIRSLDSTL